MIPPTVRHSVPLFEREWREDLQPRYRATVAAAADRVEVMAVSDLPDLIDELAAAAGEYFASVAAVAGAAYKMEMNLARVYRRHVAPSLGGSHLPLVAGFDHDFSSNGVALASLDWWFAPAYASAQGEPSAELTPGSLPCESPPKPPHSMRWHPHHGGETPFAGCSRRASTSFPCAKSRSTSGRSHGR
jgi:hypothetical protein